MVSVDKAVIARIHREGKDFEILVDPDLALEFKKGKPYGMDTILAVQEVFTDAKKGDRCPASDLQKAFRTTDIPAIAQAILLEGELQLTTEQRRKLLEEKRKQLATIISRQAVDPKTGLPHPPQRILNAMDEARVAVEPFKPAEAQVEAVLRKIEPILPISMQRLEIAVKIPAQYAGKASSLIRGFAQIKSEEWKGDGWYALLEIPAGMQAEVYGKLNDLTRGTVEVKVLKK